MLYKVNIHSKMVITNCKSIASKSHSQSRKRIKTWFLSPHRSPRTVEPPQANNSNNLWHRTTRTFRISALQARYSLLHIIHSMFKIQQRQWTIFIVARNTTLTRKTDRRWKQTRTFMTRYGRCRNGLTSLSSPYMPVGVSLRPVLRFMDRNTQPTLMSISLLVLQAITFASLSCHPLTTLQLTIVLVHNLTPISSIFPTT